MRNEIALLIAAGKGERMRPITLTTPKPLVDVCGIPMIETMIEGLRYRGVKHIYITVGYLKECFSYLTKKFDNITLIENQYFNSVNNISSVYAAKDVLGNNDVFVCEADIFVSDKKIFEPNFTKSCYYGKMVKGHSDDWVFDQDSSGRITRIGKGGNNVYNMCGVCFLKASDMRVVVSKTKELWSKPEMFEMLYWDEVVDMCLHDINMTVNPVGANQIVEIDTVAELYEVRARYEGTLNLDKAF